MGVDEGAVYMRALGDYVDTGNESVNIAFDCVVGGDDEQLMGVGVAENGARISVAADFKEPGDEKPIVVKSMWLIMETRREELKEM